MKDEDLADIVEALEALNDPFWREALILLRKKFSRDKSVEIIRLLRDIEKEEAA